MTLHPNDVGPGDVPEGVSRQALVDALYVCTYFNLIDRLADAFSFTPISQALGSRKRLLEHEANFLERGYL